GDSDFSALVLKLKEYGKYVIGVRIRESSSDLLIQNCDEYYSYNELAGFTKESDVTYVRRDPWELVVEAVKQMTAHNDVMRSDRLKQVMQEIDPTFDEKDAGFSRFSKFVVEAAHKGLINLNKLDNGQYEIALGAGVPGAAAQPAGVFSAPPHEREERSRGRERRPEAGRGRRGGGSAGGGDGGGGGRGSGGPGSGGRGRAGPGGGERPADGGVVGAAVDATGAAARGRRRPSARRPVPPRLPRRGAPRGAPGAPEDRRRGSGPELQAPRRADPDAPARHCTLPTLGPAR